MSAEAKGDVRRVSDDEFRAWTRPRLMLFLSADVENSTRLKQRNPQDPGEWLKRVFPFIDKFPTEFNAVRENCANDGERPRAENPWKVLGDEVIFAIEVTDRRQPEREVVAFARALEKWNAGGWGTTLKGAVWMAGFPVSNKIIPVLVSTELGNKSKLEPDYIGPLMDAGFRLSKDATSRRLILSVETAWWILDESLKRRRIPGLKIHFQGCLPHKGLAEETGYPLLWTGIREPEFQKHEDALLGRCSTKKADVLRKLCHDFIKEFGVPNHLPFLLKEGSLENAPPMGQKAFDALLNDARELMKMFLLVEGSPEGEPVSEEKASGEELLEELRGPLYSSRSEDATGTL